MSASGRCAFREVRLQGCLDDVGRFPIIAPTVTIPPTSSGGFSRQIRGNPPASVLKALSRPEAKCPVMYPSRCPDTQGEVDTAFVVV